MNTVFFFGGGGGGGGGRGWMGESSHKSSMFIISNGTAVHSFMPAINANILTSV